jgi:hypothetical protein
MTHFVLIVPYCLPLVQNQITEHVKSRNFGWWHWGNDCWLLVSNNDKLDASGVRSIMHEILIPQLAFLVLRVELPTSGMNWASTSVLGKEWTSWLQELWEHPDWTPK